VRGAELDPIVFATVGGRCDGVGWRGPARGRRAQMPRSWQMARLADGNEVDEPEPAEVRFRRPPAFGGASRGRIGPPVERVPIR
jgi:hypothetical protein